MGIPFFDHISSDEKCVNLCRCPKCLRSDFTRSAGLATHKKKCHGFLAATTDGVQGGPANKRQRYDAEFHFEFEVLLFTVDVS
jgi:hypothetical protein